MHALASSHNNRPPDLLLPVALIVLLILQPAVTIAANASQTVSREEVPQVEGQTSWGLGIVVPEGSSLLGGGKVNWTEISNVTTVLRIPDLTNVSAATYAVVSLMTQDGVVLQAAFGDLPGESTWLVYAMFIANPSLVPQHYTWAANASRPAAGPGDVVSISLYHSLEGTWSFKVSNLNKSLSIQKSFGANTTAPPRHGDQEVLALESYASSSTMFQNMGNMTMLSLLLNDKKVESGWYLFTDWDMIHNPLFVVGGAAPLPFVDFSFLGGGMAVWYYSGNWQGGGGEIGINPTLAEIVILLAAALLTIFMVMKFINRHELTLRRSQDVRIGKVGLGAQSPELGEELDS